MQVNMTALTVVTRVVTQCVGHFICRVFPPPTPRVRACLHGGGGPQVGEVTRLAVVEKWLAFTCNFATPGSRGDVTRRFCVVARHVNIENAGRTMHFGGQGFVSSHYLLGLQHFSAVAFYCHF